MQMPGGFNANQHEPNQGMGIHPPMQKGPFTIVGTAIKENSSKTGGYFEIEFNTPMGNIRKGYNLWYKGENEAKTVEIAHGQLSALCRAVNIYQISWENEGAVLRGGKGMMDVGYQKGEEPDPNHPERKGYTEVKRVYDPAGNEPGKGGASQAQPQPQQNQPQGGPTPVNAAPQSGGWGPGSAPAAQVNPAPANQAGGAWQPGGHGQAGAGSSPPWGSR